MRKIIILIINLLLGQNAYNQSVTNQDVLQVYPPNAYALARYGDIPIDFSTGVPDISIPLMSITDKDITINLSLSYHARGIKVDQEATWVGLGWVLNAGGVITREIRGEPDFVGKRLIIKDFVPDYSNYDKSFDNYISTEIGGIQKIAGAYNHADGESDIYYYNVNGKTGKFFIDTNEDVCLFRYDDIKIEAKNGFRITDASGIVYTFDEVGSIYQEGKFYIISWYLTKIASPSGGEIRFEYDNQSSGSTIRRTHSVHFIDASTNSGSLNVNEKICHAGDVTVSPVNESLLSKIITKSGHYVALSVSTEKRKDTQNSLGNSLKYIYLYNAQNELQKGIELNYRYFEAKNNRRYKNRYNKEVNKFNYLNYRLCLESVKEFSKLKEYANAYQFEYYGDNNSSTDDIYSLPYRLSPCQDHWGYYNNNYNTVIFPGNSKDTHPYIETDEWFSKFCYSIGYGDSFSLSPQSHVIYGANREPDAEAVKAATLNKIIYPTGGYVKFDFEANESGSLNGGLRIKQIEACDNKGVINVKKYTYSGFTQDLGSIYNNRNHYHTFLYNPILYSPDQVGSECKTYDFNTIRNVLTIMGVPAELVYNKGYNIISTPSSPEVYLRTVKVDGTSPLRLGVESDIAYSLVIEEIKGLGKTEYHYTNYSNQYDGSWIGYNEGINKNDAFALRWFRTLSSHWTSKGHFEMSTNTLTFPYPNSIDYGWKSKLLTNKRIFDTNGNLVAEDSIYYTTKLQYAVPNFKAFRLYEYDYLYTHSYTVGGMTNISKEVNKQYKAGNIVRTSKEYEYTSPYHKKITETRTLTSTGDFVKERYYYPTEYGNYFSTLKNKNILTPIDIRTYRNNKLILGYQFEYDDSGLLKTKYKMESLANDIVFNSSKPYTFSPYLWNTYNQMNLLLTQTDRSNTPAVYLWSYSGQYPIAEIKNTTYEEINKFVNPDALSSKLMPSDADMKAVNDLRTKLPNALVSTYTYKPLVGMLTSTDPRGITTYYEYDSFGRLQYTYIEELDSSGKLQKKVVQKYDYHYRNQ